MKLLNTSNLSFMSIIWFSMVSVLSFAILSSIYFLSSKISFYLILFYHLITELLFTKFTFWWIVDSCKKFYAMSYVVRILFLSPLEHFSCFYFVCCMFAQLTYQFFWSCSCLIYLSWYDMGEFLSFILLYLRPTTTWVAVIFFLSFFFLFTEV